jgi:drug/metabolite transporter (DMT)-like permease
MDRRAWAMLLTLASVWGASYLLIKVGLEDMPPAAIAFLRVAVAAALLVPLALHRRALAGLRPHAGAIAVLAVAQIAGPFLLIAVAEQDIDSGLTAILVATAPVFTAVLALAVDHDERSHGAALAGILVGLAGVALLLGVDTSAAELVGGLLVVAAGFGYAVGGFVAKRRLATVDPVGLAAAAMALSAVLSAPFAVVSAPDAVPAAGPLAAVIALGLVGTGLAFVLFYSLIARVGPARSLVVTYMAPGFAVVYGALLLDERVTATTIAGLALVLGGSWLAAEGRLPWRMPRPQGRVPRLRHAEEGGR